MTFVYTTCGKTITTQYFVDNVLLLSNVIDIGVGCRFIFFYLDFDFLGLSEFKMLT